MEHILIRKQVPTVWEKPMFGLWLPQSMRRCQRNEALANNIISVKVCIADADVEKGSKLEEELSGYVHSRMLISALHAHVSSQKD